MFQCTSICRTTKRLCVCVCVDYETCLLCIQVYILFTCPFPEDIEYINDEIVFSENPLSSGYI